jgi:hypothetical protein
MQPAWKFEGRLRELGRELIADIAGTPAASPLSVSGLNGSTQHFMFEGKDGV